MEQLPQLSLIIQSMCSSVSVRLYFVRPVGHKESQSVSALNETLVGTLQASLPLWIPAFGTSFSDSRSSTTQQSQPPPPSCASTPTHRHRSPILGLRYRLHCPGDCRHDDAAREPPTGRLHLRLLRLCTGAGPGLEATLHQPGPLDTDPRAPQVFGLEADRGEMGFDGSGERIC